MKMKTLPVILCIHWLFVGVCEVLGLEAEDCALYESNDPAWKTMYRQLSIGIIPGDNDFVANLELSSQNAEGKCTIIIYNGILGVNCLYRSSKYDWSPEIFKLQDTTDLWIHVGSLNDNKDPNSSDMAVIGRRGNHRNQFLFPFSGLQPPIRVHWKPHKKMNYYYNCVTGCLYTKSAVTSPGTHYLFLRPGHNFTHIHIRYNSTDYGKVHELILNATDIPLDDNWKNMTVVWNNGDIGVLLDGATLRGLKKYSRLDGRKNIEAEITDGGGHLTLCDRKFNKVAEARSDEELVNATKLPLFTTTQNPSEGYDVNNNWLVVMALVCLAVLLLVAIVLVVLLLKTKNELQRERNASARDVIPVDTFEGGQTATFRSTAPLYSVAHTHDSHATTASFKDSNGPKTQQEC